MESLGAAILAFVVSAALVVVAGIGLARFGDELAEKTGWGSLWVGTLLVGIATSLPEVTVNISAVWLEDAPSLALGNVFGADMMNIFVLALVALAFGATKVCGNQGRDTRILIVLGVGLVAVAIVLGASGDLKLGPTSLGGLLIAAVYVGGMRIVYQAGRTDMDLADIPRPTGRARRAWIGFGISALVVIVAARYLAASADKIAEISGISASFIGVLLVSIVTTLPEGSVTVAAALRRSYGIVLGNVYGSCAFNVFIVPLADLFHTKGPLLGTMESEHFVAAGTAFALLSMGYLIVKGCQFSAFVWVRILTPAIPVIYLVGLYVVFVLGQS